jgi:hypothetical protein
MFDGKTLKHLKPDEVEDYRAAIASPLQNQLLIPILYDFALYPPSVYKSGAIQTKPACAGY